MTAVWRNLKRQAVRVLQAQGWVPFHSQRTTTKGQRRMAVLVRQSIWKMVGANTTLTTLQFAVGSPCPVDLARGQLEEKGEGR